MPTTTTEAPTAVASAGGVSVKFGAEASTDSYTITAKSTGKSCSTPCALDLAPGSQEIEVSGASAFTTTVEVPSAGGEMTVHRVHAGNLVGGAVLLPLGGGALVGSVAVLTAKSSSSSSYDSYDSSYDSSESRDSRALTVAILLPLGVLGTTAGITLLAMMGSNGIDPKPATTGRGSPPTSLAFGAAPTRGGAFCGAALTF